MNEEYRKGFLDALKQLDIEMYRQAFEVDHEEDGLQKWDSGNWIRYKLFENVMYEIYKRNNLEPGGITGILYYNCSGSKKK